MDGKQLADIEERSKKVVVLVPSELFPTLRQFMEDNKALIAEVKRLRLEATYNRDTGRCDGDAA